MSLHNSTLQSPRPFNFKTHHMIGFGEERTRLANYVADQLNLKHQNDAAILDKFRKEAEQYKRNLLRRNHQPQQVQQEYHTRSFTEGADTAPDVKLKVFTKPIKHKIKRKYKRNFFPDLEQSSSSSSSDSESDVDLSLRNEELIRLVKKKDKEMIKQTEAMIKNEKRLNDMKKRIEILEKQTNVKESNKLEAIENSSYDQIKNAISEMSKKLLQNQSIIQENLIKRNIQPNTPFHSSRAYPEGQTVKFKVKNRKFIYNPEQTLNPERVEYKYRVQSEREFQKESGGIESAITNLGEIRRRLDSLSSFIEN